MYFFTSTLTSVHLNLQDGKWHENQIKHCQSGNETTRNDKDTTNGPTEPPTYMGTNKKVKETHKRTNPRTQKTHTHAHGNTHITIQTYLRNTDTQTHRHTDTQTHRHSHSVH